MAKEMLTVKNFGPIREAHLDLQKVTVLIGEQASGKSVLAKLVAIFRNVQYIISQNSNEWFEHFSILQYLNENTDIYYESDFYSIKVEKGEVRLFNVDKQILLFHKLQSIQQRYKGQYNLLDKEQLQTFQEATEQITTLEKEVQKYGQDAIYIPAERILISILSEASFSLQLSQVSLPKFLLMFGRDYEKSRKHINQLEIITLDLKYSYLGGVDIVEYNNAKTKLSESASGLQSILPLLLVVEDCSNSTVTLKMNFRFIIEEPELNLYPTTQKKLVEYLIEKCTIGDNRLIITTHSPYILTALNNCIQARNTLREHPEHADEVAKLVRPESQIDFEDVMTYFVAGGTARPIMNNENRLIDANTLDDVSDELGDIFDRLLDLEMQTA
ncbi:MAG: hypothetical protein DYG98_05595 [Haliscomenobacteraceae bacterium CHB4]|nr:hypothetical protein [Haliscomenobacteraceae bacterium CHB4]